MMHRVSASLLFLLRCSPSHAARVYYNWTLQPFLDNSKSPDCMNDVGLGRYLFLAEDSFPGPTIDVDEGDEVHIRVTNMHQSSGVTIHYHGIHQNGSPYSDGPAFVTQCPLGPFESQEYVFNAYPPGTHFWHAHMSLHAADGMSGAFIVRPKAKEPFQYDEERIMYLQDWYSKTGPEQLTGLFTWPFAWIGNPNSLLINGKGVAFECTAVGIHAGNPDFCLDTCQGSLLNLLNVTTVQSGKTYRLRLINAGQLVMMNFAIANHNLTIVQVEGTNVKPFTVESLDVAPGGRYDVLLVANKPAGSYWIETTIRERDISNVTGRAILQYVSATLSVPENAPTHPKWNQTSHGIAQDSSLFTLAPNSHPEQVALKAKNVKRYVFVGTQNQVIVNGNATRLVWAVNNISNMPQSAPLLGKAVLAAKELGWPTTLQGTLKVTATPPYQWNYTDIIPVDRYAVGSVGESVVQFDAGDVFEFVMQNALALNGVAEFHPWHSHGHSFWVVGRGPGNFNAETDTANYNLKNPLLRDTVTLWPREWVALRFVANNPGVWFYHCHIMAHEVMGMALHIVTQPDQVDDPSESVLYCDRQSLSAGAEQGSANGSNLVNEGSGGLAPIRAGALSLLVPLLTSTVFLQF